MNSAKPNECLVVVDGYNLYYYWKNRISELRAEKKLQKWGSSQLRYDDKPGEWLWYDLFDFLKEPVSDFSGGASIGKLYYCSARYNRDVSGKNSIKIQDAFVRYHVKRHNQDKQGDGTDEDEKFVRKFGEFKSKKLAKRCSECGSLIRCSKKCKKPVAQEEKQTDVNIAIICIDQLLVRENYDKVCIISGDYDFAPVVNFINEKGRDAWQIGPEKIEQDGYLENLRQANFSLAEKNGVLRNIPSPEVD